MSGLRSSQPKVSESEPIQRAIDVRALVELLEDDLQFEVADQISDTERADVKHILIELSQSILKLKIAILESAERLNELPI